MLTQEDLAAIQQLIQTETRAIVQSETQAIVQSETRIILQEELMPIRKDIKVLKTGVRRLRKTVDVAIRHFDTDQTNLRKRIKRVEDHLEISSI